MPKDMLRMKNNSDMFASLGNPWSGERRKAAYIPSKPTKAEERIEAVMAKYGLPSRRWPAELKEKYRGREEPDLDYQQAPAPSRPPHCPVETGRTPDDRPRRVYSRLLEANRLIRGNKPIKVK